MYQITAIYAHPESPEAFVEHYRTTHAPLARELPKLTFFGWTVFETADGSRPRYLVGSPGGIAPPGSHGTERDSLPSLRSSHRIRQKALVHAQCLNRPGSRATRAVHQALKRLKLRNRLYFF